LWLDPESAHALDLANQISASRGQFRSRIVVRSLCRSQPDTHLFQVLYEPDKLVVDGGTMPRDFLGIPALVLAPPDVRYDAKGCEKCTRADKHDISVPGVHVKLSVAHDGQHKGGLNWYEH
jgi:hypothetical protein